MTLLFIILPILLIAEHVTTTQSWIPQHKIQRASSSSNRLPNNHHVRDNNSHQRLNHCRLATSSTVAAAATATAASTAIHPVTKSLTTTTTTTTTALYAKSKNINNKETKKQKGKQQHNKNKIPKLIIFDLDGCLWSPEMYEILYYSQGQGSPFTLDEYDTDIVRTVAGEPVKLLGSVRDVLYELQYDEKWWNTNVGISSKTDEPNWARELLETFIIGTTNNGQGEEKKKNNVNDMNIVVAEGEEEAYPPFPMGQVFTNEICELAYDSKVSHFERILQNASGKPKYQDCLFFDNELGNCQQVAKLGVTVCYCPRGVTKEDWDSAIQNFPCTNGKIIGR